MHYVFVINGRPDKSFIGSVVKKQISEIPSFTDYEIYVTKDKLDATRFVSSYEVKQNEQVCFVACGGDGTANEVASGLVGQENKLLAILAYGTGNDFVKYYPNNDFKNIKALLHGTVQKIDILKVNDRYSLNVCNIGFEAAVASIANGLPRNVNGKSVYRKALLRGLIFHRKNRLNIFADGDIINKSPFLISSFANCRYVGGEFMCAPRAVNNDGFMELCVIKSMNLLRMIPYIDIYKNGKHLDSSKFTKYITYRRVKYVVVTASHEFEACIDGEIIINSRFDIDLLPLAVNFVVPESL